MLDMKFLRENPDVVKENIKKKFQDEKLPLVDQVIEMDKEYRAAKVRGDELRAERKSKSKLIGGMMAKGDKEGAEADMRKYLELRPEELNGVNGEYKAEGVEEMMKRAYSAINPFGL